MAEPMSPETARDLVARLRRLAFVKEQHADTYRRTDERKARELDNDVEALRAGADALSSPPAPPETGDGGVLRREVEAILRRWRSQLVPVIGEVNVAMLELRAREAYLLESAPPAPPREERCYAYECSTGDCVVHDTPTDWVECVGARCPVSGQIVESRPEPPEPPAPPREPSQIVQRLSACLDGQEPDDMAALLIDARDAIQQGEAALNEERRSVLAQHEIIRLQREAPREPREAVRVLEDVRRKLESLNESGGPRSERYDLFWLWLSNELAALRAEGSSGVRLPTVPPNREIHEWGE